MRRLSWNDGAPVIVEPYPAVRRFFEGTTTPLASIFGSGFLVIVSVLAGAVGSYAVFAMAGICAVAYAVGAVIRFNILNAEPILRTGTASLVMQALDRVADMALVPAYVISVTLYLRILSSYALGFFDIDTEFNERVLTTAVVAFILIIGLIRGLEILESLEKWALLATMVIILLLIAAFAFHDVNVLAAGTLTLPDPVGETPWQIVTVLAGTLIVVQGFETTRYLGDEYDRETRARACRNAQIISTAVYLLFVALATPLMHISTDDISENALLDLAGAVAIWLPAPLVLAAVFSQFSAATADTIGASGNIMEFTRHRVGEKSTYVLICVCAGMLTWTGNTLEILTLASRAFAFYYLMQCLIAFSIAESSTQRVVFALMATALLFITAFAVPVG